MQTCNDAINRVGTDLFRTFGGIEDKSGNNAVLVKFDHQVFGAALIKKAIVIVTVSPRLHTIFYSRPPG